jgi:hypothetical protein
MKLALILACALSVISSSSKAPKPETNLKADYIEVRTASVFAGPCHVNGELMTTGNDALMAWRFDNGVRVMAAVSGQDNLIHKDAARQSEIIIDSSGVTTGSKTAADAALAAIVSHDSASLGKIVSVRQGAVHFALKDREYHVDAAGFGSMDVQGLPDCDCCKQPNNVWYEPLVKVSGQMVGYTVTAEYSSGAAGNTWQREDENGAFYGIVAY